MGNDTQNEKRAKGSIDTFEKVIDNFGKIASMHLKINDDIQIKTSYFDLNFERFTKLKMNKTNHTFINYPDNYMDLYNTSKNSIILQKAVLSKFPLSGSNNDQLSNIKNSSQLSLSFDDEFNKEQFKIENLTDPFVFKIPRNLSDNLFDYINITYLNSTYFIDNQFLTFSFDTQLHHLEV